MIYAVAAGLALLFVTFFLVIFSGGGSKQQTLQNTLAYLKNTEGLLEVKVFEKERRALIVFNSNAKNAANFEKIAHYAALRLAYQFPDCQVQLAKNQATQLVYTVRVKGGVIASEGPVQPGNDRL